TPPVAVAAPASAVAGPGAAAPAPGVAGCGPAARPGTAPPPAGAVDAGASPPQAARSSASGTGSSRARPVLRSQPHIARLRRLHFRVASRLAESPQFVLHRLDMGVEAALVQHGRPHL